MNWLTEVFKPFAATKGALLQKDDILFISNYLAKMPQSCHKRVLKRYLREWLEAMAIEPKTTLKQNMGRKKANVFLRELMEG